ncbi:MAG: nitrilase-related carbon-nitrogen hydrolase [Planctomycetota bacterium]
MEPNSPAPPLKTTRVFLAQTAPALGDVNRNIEEHLTILENAKKDGAGLVVFPELSLTGYFLHDLADEVAMAPDDARLRRVLDATKTRKGAEPLAAVVGFVERTRDHRLYNSAAFIENGNIVHIHRKVYLPTYGIFDDGRYLAAGSGFFAFDASFGRIGILICEDAWHLASSYLLFLQNVDLLICVSSSPGRGITERGDVSASRSWDAVLEAVSNLFQTYCVYCNRSGVEDGITFFGGSRVFDPFGTVIAKIDGLDTGSIVTEIDGGALRRARLFAPMRRDEKPELVLRQLQKIVEQP